MMQSASSVSSETNMTTFSRHDDVHNSVEENIEDTVRSAILNRERFESVADHLERLDRAGKTIDDKRRELLELHSQQEPETKTKKNLSAKIVHPGEFESEKHYYPRVLNASIHPLVQTFLELGNARIVARYCHLNPLVDRNYLAKLLVYKPKYFMWAGSDLFSVTTDDGNRQMIIIETNSCPSGQKSMPLLQDSVESGGYGIVIGDTFKSMIQSANREDGGLAVVYDKNEMEASGYAAVLADTMNESVFLVEYYVDDMEPPVKWIDKLMYIKDKENAWHPIRACFRYTTQQPWNRFPLNSRTIVLNNIIACLSGGRNKMMANRSYDLLNAELRQETVGLSIRVPETVENVSLSEIGLFVARFGGHAVIKEPYGNAGQGVFTITNHDELRDFLNKPHHYDKFIVQAMVGNASWSSTQREGKFYHVGTLPDKKCRSYVTDLRMMVSATQDGFRPVSLYARRARKPLLTTLEDDLSVSSWEMLGTNLSCKENGKWLTETSRLLLMDRKDFNTLGISVDDMIDAYVQTVLSVIAIDKMCERLLTNGTFNHELFEALNPDKVLLSEIQY